MSVLSHGHDAHAHDGEPGIWSRTLDIVVDLGRAFADARRMQASYETLSRMSDHELAKIGLTRTDIPRAVFAPLQARQTARSTHVGR